MKIFDFFRSFICGADEPVKERMIEFKEQVFFKPERRVNQVFIHCSASDLPEHDSVSVMRVWHMEKGWSDVGYHFFITKGGEIQTGRYIERTPAAQKGHNRNTIAICLHGLEESKFTNNQKLVFCLLCKEINEAYDGDITFHGHKEVNSHKECPVIDYVELLNLDEKGYIK